MLSTAVTLLGYLALSNCVFSDFNRWYRADLINMTEGLVDDRVTSVRENVELINNSRSRMKTVGSESSRMPKLNKSYGKRKRQEAESGDEGRFLSILEVVNFANGNCLSSNGLSGTCYHEYECATLGGSNLGNCAAGLGVCCILQYSCGDETSADISWFTNPGFPTPSSERLACSFTIYKAAADVMQLRIDFESFEVQPPYLGACSDDQFVVSGQNINSNVPVLCGINNKQHMYIQVDESDGPFYLSLQTAEKGPRLFSIKVSQLQPGNSLLAPGNCLQYYKGETGTFETFNYQDKSHVAVERNPSYFNNMNYAICISKMGGFCTVTYSNINDSLENQFQLANVDNEGRALIPPNQAGAEIFNCPDDFIIANGIRLCGDKLNDASVVEDFTLNAPITEMSTGPIVFSFRTNQNVVGRGFKIYYRQNMCILS